MGSRALPLKASAGPADEGRRRVLVGGSAAAAGLALPTGPADAGAGGRVGNNASNHASNHASNSAGGKAAGGGFVSSLRDEDLPIGHLLREPRRADLAMGQPGPGEPSAPGSDRRQAADARTPDARTPDARLAEGRAVDGRHREVHTVDVLIVGAGISGLAAARQLKRAGIDRYQLLELGTAAGGNSRPATLGGLPCPTGAHYLPLPGPDAVEVIDLLTELGVRDGAGHYDERMLIHSPQERLFLHGGWQEGLLPLIAQPPSTLDQYRRFADTVDRWRQCGAFTIPVARSRPGVVGGRGVAALQDLTFARWLDETGFDAPALRWYLDYCCRDDYGAGSAVVSAWAGLHYFASRHGFGLAGREAAGEAGGEGVIRHGKVPVAAGEAMLTWPEGNGWLAGRLARPHQDRLALRHLVRRIQRSGRRANAAGTGAAGWIVDALDLTDVSRPRARRWQAGVVIWAAPTHVAGHVIDGAEPEAHWIADAAAGLVSAPWLVANVLVDEGWEPSGGELAWDNVIYGSEALGYVNARHQRLDRRVGPALLTWYQALGDRPEARAWLAAGDLAAMTGRCVADLARAHPEIRPWIREIAVQRWGHAMAIPTPAAHRNAGLARLRDAGGDLLFAHSDLSGYSIFEEAMHRGGLAAERALRWLETGRR